MKAIETRYKGYNFRSRLEARWAVYFDELRVDWEYEKEGFELPSGRYLPDFYFPWMSVWAEVKPDRELTREENIKLYEFSTQPGVRMILLSGPPELQSYPVLTASWEKRADGRRKLGDMRCVLSMCGGSCFSWPQFFFYRPDGRQPDRGAYQQVWEEDFSDVEDAVLAARSARFEFGHSGATA